MRRIDGDAFAEFLKDAVKRQKYEDIKIGGLLTVADVIEAVISELEGTSLDGFKNAPTIEPERKKGKWIFVHPLQSDDPGAYMCSECKMGMWEIIPSKYHYCPNCGCQMEGEEDEMH